MKEFDKELEHTITQTIETEIEQQTQGEKNVTAGVAIVVGIAMILVGIRLLKTLNKENKYVQVASWTLVGIGFSGIVINGIRLFWGLFH